VGVNKSVSWPGPRSTNLGAKGNNGVTALIDQTPGAMGYVESGYAELADLNMAALENRKGKFVVPDVATGQAALAGAVLPKNFRLFIPDPEGEKAYPIVTYTWMLVLKRYPDAKKARWVREALVYGLTKGQAFSEKLGYIPLPENIVKTVMPAVKSIEPRDEE
jgi:phosphate transport system substrate-binding protein